MSSPFLNLPSNHPVPPTVALYVRALYDYESNSSSSISFRAGDLIRVLNRLDSGWWDGILDNVRGWFPSNYTVIVAEEPVDPDEDVHLQALTGQLQQAQIYEDDEPEESTDGTADVGTAHNANYEQSDLQRGNHDQNHGRRSPETPEDGMSAAEESNSKSDQEKASWVPRLTQNGQVFYFNELTGESAVDIAPDDIISDSPSVSSRRNTVINANVPSALQQHHSHISDSSRGHAHGLGHAVLSSTASNRIPPESLIAGMNQDEAVDDERYGNDRRTSVILDSTLAQLVSSSGGPMPSGTGLEDESTLIGNTTITPANAGLMNSNSSARMSGTLVSGNGFARKPSVATVNSTQSSGTISAERDFGAPSVTPAASKAASISSNGSASADSSSSETRELSPHSRQALAERYAHEGLQSQDTVVPDIATTTFGASTTTASTTVRGNSISRSRGNTIAANESSHPSTGSLHFLPDTQLPIRPTWSSILAYTRSAVAQYRFAVSSQKLQLYIPLVENISDQLRFLLAAASDTTDNHSGTPSVISGNKELSPEFRNMMSKFSKMVVNSHLAIGAAEYAGKPTPSSSLSPSLQGDGVADVTANGSGVGNGSEKLMDAEMKCIAESHGFEEAMEQFVGKARELRGEDVVQLIPAFVAGSEKAGSGICVGGNWSGNGLFDETRGGAVRSISSIMKKKAAKEEKKKDRKKVASAFLELNDNDDDDDDDEDENGGTKSSAERDNEDVLGSDATGHGTGDESRTDDGTAGQFEDDPFEDIIQGGAGSDGYGWEQYYQCGDLDSLSDDDDHDYDFSDEDDDDDDESYDLGLNLGSETSSAESTDGVINSGTDKRLPSRYNAVRRPRRDPIFTTDENEGSDSATMGMGIDGKTKHPHGVKSQEDYDTDASMASLAAAAAAADTAVRNRIGRGRTRTNTLNSSAGTAVSPGPNNVLGGRSVSVSASASSGSGKAPTAASLNRNTVIIEGDAPESDGEAPNLSEKTTFTEKAKKKLDAGATKSKRAPATGSIRSKPMHPHPRIRLTPRSLQKITPLRTALESALRKLDTSTATTVNAIGGSSNRSSASAPKPPSKDADIGNYGLGMTSPSLTLSSSMSSVSMSMSASAHTPSTLTVAGRDALAERVCTAAAEVLRSFQPLARFLERFDLRDLMDDAFVESLHSGFVDGIGTITNAQGQAQTPPTAVRTGSDMSSESLPGNSGGYPVAGNGFANLMQQPTPTRVFIGEDAFGNPTLGQSMANAGLHNASLQSPSLNSPSGSNTALSVPPGDRGSSFSLPSPSSSTAGSAKALPKPVTQAQALMDAFAYKQRLYDAIGALVLACQTIGAPLADEWCAVAEEDGLAGDTVLRGAALEAMDDRIGMLRGTVGMVKGILEQLTIALQTLLGFGVAAEQARRKTLAIRRQGMGGLSDVRSSSAVRASRGGGAMSMKFSSSAGPPEYKGARKARMMKMNVQPSIDKANRFFGEKTPTTPTHTSFSPGGHGGAGADHRPSRVPPPPIPVSAGLAGVFGGCSVPSPTNTTPWFLSCDHEHDVTFEEREGTVMLKSGTLPGLVEQLTRHDKLDTSFHSTFLLTYRSFTTATELLEILVHRFTLPAPFGLDPTETQLWTRMKQSPIRIRVVNTLKTWLENYWMEPKDDGKDGPTTRLLNQIEVFVSNAVVPTKTPGATQLLALVQKRQQMGLEGKDQQIAMSRKMTPHIKAVPTPLLPKSMKKLKLLDINPEEMARQLSLIEIKLYARIRPTECLNKTWTKKMINPADGQQFAPNIKAMIKHSNQLTNWVAETILRQSDVKRRVAVIKFFTNVADRCGKMNNYSSLMTIISALATAPIDRLGRTWYQVSARTMAMLERMRTLMQTTKNFGLYRQTIHNVNPPCIPFLGIYLTDLIFTEDGIPSKTPEDASHINFSKWRKTAAIIQEIQQFQNGTYQFQPVPELQEWILQQMHEAQDCSTKAAYDRSLEIEPREREDEKITRLLSESGFL